MARLLRTTGEKAEKLYTKRRIRQIEQKINDKLSDDGGTFTEFLDTVAQAEAEAGTATTRRIWTAQRVAQAIAALAGSGTNFFGVEVFTASGNFTWPSGSTDALVILQGAGGGGGGVGSTSGEGYGGSGAAGETRIGLVTKVDATAAVVIGALGAGATVGNAGGTGGDTTIQVDSGGSADITAKGGTGGAGTVGNTIAADGSTPTGSGGFIIPNYETQQSSSRIRIRAGGCWFGPPIILGTTSNASGVSGIGSGSGGIGGYIASGTTTATGGAGTAGLVIVIAF